MSAGPVVVFSKPKRSGALPPIAHKATRLFERFPEHAAVIEQTIDAMLNTRYDDSYCLDGKTVMISAVSSRAIEGEVIAERLTPRLARTIRFMSDDEIELLEVLALGVRWLQDDLPHVRAAARRTMKKGKPQRAGEHDDREGA
jgi:hypothetical protein